eukprot:3807799-Prymnesium_polylepis.1
MKVNIGQEAVALWLSPSVVDSEAVLEVCNLLRLRLWLRSGASGDKGEHRTGGGGGDHVVCLLDRLDGCRLA